jgi:galactokinase
MDLFVPGRLCLFGEHSDWAGAYRRTHRGIEPGLCLAVGTDQGIHATAQPVEGRLELVSRLPGGGDRREVLSLDEPELALAARAGGFFSYAAGSALEMVLRFGVGGMRLICHEMTLPLRKGLSSSAAICVLVVRALARLYGVALDTREEMEIAYRGEVRTPSRCGRMDQVCAFGAVPCALRFDGDVLDVQPLVVGGTFHLLIVDLDGRKDTVRILADLDAQFPDTAGPMAAAVRRALGPENLRLGAAAIEAIEAGDGRQLGRLMTGAQRVFDRLVAPACPSELTAPLLHRVLEHEPLRDLVWGGKGVGSQGDGTAQLLARGEGDRDRVREILRRDLGLESYYLTLNP